MSYASYRKTHPLNDCPLNAAIAAIGRWKIKILSWLAESLTEHGRALLPALEHVTTWGRSHVARYGA